MDLLLVSGTVLLIIPLLSLVYFRGWGWRKKQGEIDTEQRIVHERPE